VHTSVCLSACLPACLPTPRLSIRLSVRPSVLPPVCLRACPAPSINSDKTGLILNLAVWGMAWVQVGIQRTGNCGQAPWTIDGPLFSKGVSVSTVSKWMTDKSKHRAHFGT
jgi:hypothetical protein